MRSKRTLVLAIVLTTLTAGFADRIDAHDELVQEDTRPILVKYSSGAVERYVAKWDGIVSMHEWETGDPASWSFNKVHAVDDRQCHWELGVKIVRRLYFVNEQGEQFAKAETVLPYDKFFQNGGASIRWDLRGENCNDADTRFKSDVKDAHGHLQEHFQPVVNADVAALRQQISGWKNVVKVSYDDQLSKRTSAPPQRAKPTRKAVSGS